MTENTPQTITPLLVDSHEDLAWNMLTFARDYRLSVQQTRQKEAGTIIPTVNGDTMLGWDEYQSIHTAIIFATLFAAPNRFKEGEWDILSYKDTRTARQLYWDQLDVYDRLTGENPGFFQSIQNRSQLELIIDAHTPSINRLHDTPPIGLVYLMEGADGILEPAEVERWYERGVRIFGLAWASTRYCGGTKEPGPLTRDGVQLIKHIEELGAILDISHMDHLSVKGVFDHYNGRIIATHANADTPLKARESNRFLKDDVIVQLAERGGVVGVIPYNLFLDANWQKGGRKEDVPISAYVDQIDYICQLLGSAAHVGIGTDFDGGFGYQSSPLELNSIADMRCIIPLLEKKGYTLSEISGIFGLNWIEYLRKNLPG